MFDLSLYKIFHIVIAKILSGRKINAIEESLRSKALYGTALRF
jgi:hypothetical protein